MLCRVCRDDLPQSQFHAAEYLNARIQGNTPVCFTCKPLTKKDRKKRTADALSALGHRSKEQVKAWRALDPDQKKQSQMEKRTASEKALERALRQAGVNFKVQHPIGCYWADFYIPESSVVVEVDGSIHNTQAQREYDIRRNQWMESAGHTVLRFTNKQVADDLNGVVGKIKEMVAIWRGVGKKKKRSLSKSARTAFDAPVYVPPNRIN